MFARWHRGAFLISIFVDDVVDRRWLSAGGRFSSSRSPDAVLSQVFTPLD